MITVYFDGDDATRWTCVVSTTDGRTEAIYYKNTHEEWELVGPHWK